MAEAALEGDVVGVSAPDSVAGNAPAVEVPGAVVGHGSVCRVVFCLVARVEVVWVFGLGW